MTPEKYKVARKRLGTQAEVAKMLGVSRQLLSMRETGSEGTSIDREAVLAMRYLLERRNE